MNNVDIEDMLSDLVTSLDYDIWKETFLGDKDDPQIQHMIKIVRGYMKPLLDQMEEDQFYIECLHSGGVDNWEWYGESLQPYYEKYEG